MNYQVKATYLYMLLPRLRNMYIAEILKATAFTRQYKTIYYE